MVLQVGFVWILILISDLIVNIPKNAFEGTNNYPLAVINFHMY